MTDPGQSDSAAAIIERRIAKLDELLDFAFEELLWISEHPNRVGDPCMDPEDIPAAAELAERARAAIGHIEREDPRP